jgi:hypothetical protein
MSLYCLLIWIVSDEKFSVFIPVYVIFLQLLLIFFLLFKQFYYDVPCAILFMFFVLGIC